MGLDAAGPRLGYGDRGADVKGNPWNSLYVVVGGTLPRNGLACSHCRQASALARTDAGNTVAAGGRSCLYERARILRRQSIAFQSPHLAPLCCHGYNLPLLCSTLVLAFVVRVKVPFTYYYYTEHFESVAVPPEAHLC